MYISNYFLAALQTKILKKLYTSLGCWKDTGHRAVPTLEGTDPLLKGGYTVREFAIEKCYKVAKSRGFHIFAVQHGGWCAGMVGSERYKKYGKATNCKNGKGGAWANDVYQIGGIQYFVILYS